MRKNSITVHGEQWDVPFGFGREYMRTVKGEAHHLADGKPGLVIEIIRNQLELIGYTASVETISNWPRPEDNLTRIGAANAPPRIELIVNEEWKRSTR